MDQFDVGSLAKEHNLVISETDKALLPAEDFLEALRCHWVTDTNSFPHERQRAQVATILLLATVTSCCPGVLLGVTYGDIHLFVLRDPKTGEIALTLQLRLTKTKSREKQKCLRTYTFFVNSNLLTYPIVALACDDQAFLFSKTTPRVVLTLGVRPGLNCQPFPWRDDRRISQSSAYPALRTEKIAKSSASRFPTASIRKAAGNVIYNDSNSNEAVRNVVLNHTSLMIFQRDDLSRMIRYDTHVLILEALRHKET